MFLEPRLELMHIGALNNGEILRPIVLGGEGRPRGENILWTSPARSKYNWFRFCTENYTSWLEDKDNKRWAITIESANIATVKYIKDYQQLFQSYPPTENSVPLDWVKLSTNYDAFWLKSPALYRLMNKLGCWDCDTVVIFNPSVVSSVRLLSS